MKKSIIIFVAAIVLVLLFSPIALSSQEQPETQAITVRSKELSNGVVILSVQQGDKIFDLQCNKDFPGCAVLDRGDYLMARLPKNRGMYDCANAEVFRRSADSEVGDKIGQYCIVQAK